MRGVRDVSRGASPRHASLRRRIAEIVLSILVIDAIGTMLMLGFEHDAARSEIPNVGDALFWTTAQLLTVSSQMKNPVTTGGRIVDVFLDGLRDHRGRVARRVVRELLPARRRGGR